MPSSVRSDMWFNTCWWTFFVLSVAGGFLMILAGNKASKEDCLTGTTANLDASDLYYAQSGFLFIMAALLLVSYFFVDDSASNISTGCYLYFLATTLVYSILMLIVMIPDDSGGRCLKEYNWRAGIVPVAFLLLDCYIIYNRKV